MTPQEINEFLGREVMGWTLRLSKNPDYDWWVNRRGQWQCLARQWNPRHHYFGLRQCFAIIEQLTADGFVGFKLEQVACVDGFTWAASIKGRIDQLTGMRLFFGGAGKTPEEAICSMAVKAKEYDHV